MAAAICWTVHAIVSYKEKLVATPEGTLCTRRSPASGDPTQAFDNQLRVLLPAHLSQMTTQPQWEIRSCT